MYEVLGKPSLLPGKVFPGVTCCEEIVYTPVGSPSPMLCKEAQKTHLFWAGQLVTPTALTESPGSVPSVHNEQLTNTCGSNHLGIQHLLSFKAPALL